MPEITLEDYAAMSEEERMCFAVGALAAVAAVQDDVDKATVETSKGPMAGVELPIDLGPVDILEGVRAKVLERIHAEFITTRIRTDNFVEVNARLEGKTKSPKSKSGPLSSKKTGVASRA